MKRNTGKTKILVRTGLQANLKGEDTLEKEKLSINSMSKIKDQVNISR